MILQCLHFDSKRTYILQTNFVLKNDKSVNSNSVFEAVIRQTLHITICEKVCGQTSKLFHDRMTV